MKNKKIYFYISNLAKGGAERVCINLAEYLYSSGYEVAIITSYKSKIEYNLSSKINRIVLNETYYSGNIIYRNLILIKKLRQIIKNDKPDTIISFMAESNFRLLLSTIGLYTKRIVSVRNDPDKEYKGIIGRIVGKLILPTADGCVFQTEQAKNWFPKKLRDKSAVIKNPVREEVFQIVRNPIYGRIINIGRLEDQKNHKMLINAYEIVLNKYPNSKLLIYGEGSLRNELVKIIDHKGLNENIELCGYFDDIDSTLSKADIFILSSDYEGLPNSLMEALSSGVPCISTDCPCGGPRSLIENGVNGMLVPIKDEIKLSEAIIDLLSNKSKKESFSKKAKEMSKSYKTSIINNEWKEYIDLVVNNSKTKKG
ncbi:MAG: glycosyltransferase [Anaerococcus hydrogenalis]|nr:glycosyltransferase [Anaerococcus hydrogenalis]